MYKELKRLCTVDDKLNFIREMIVVLKKEIVINDLTMAYYVNTKRQGSNDYFVTISFYMEK